MYIITSNEESYFSSDDHLLFFNDIGSRTIVRTHVLCAGRVDANHHVGHVYPSSVLDVYTGIEHATGIGLKAAAETASYSNSSSTHPVRGELLAEEIVRYVQRKSWRICKIKSLFSDLPLIKIRPPLYSRLTL